MPVAKHRKNHKKKVNEYKQNLRNNRKRAVKQYIEQLNKIILEKTGIKTEEKKTEEVEAGTDNV